MCSPFPAFLCLHCWDRAKKAAKTRKSQLVMLLSVGVGDNLLLILLVQDTVGVEICCPSLLSLEQVMDSRNEDETSDWHLVP